MVAFICQQCCIVPAGRFCFPFGAEAGGDALVVKMAVPHNSVSCEAHKPWA